MMKKTKNKRKIRNFLKRNRFKGLSYNNECLCELNNLLHCGEMKSECKPFRIKDVDSFEQLKAILKDNKNGAKNKKCMENGSSA